MAERLIKAASDDMKRILAELEALPALVKDVE